MSLYVSVIIPTFNRCDSLRITLDGLSKQVFSDSEFEVVVVSDGSTDGTSDMIARYALSAPFTLRLFEQANGGPARARNHGIANAHGEVIVFLDDDVEPAPDFIIRHATHHKNNSSLGVVGPMLPAQDRQHSEPVWIAWEHAMLEKQYKAWSSGKWTGVGAHHFYSGNASVRREHLIAIGGFNEKFGRQEDVELAVRLETERSIEFRFDADAIGIHRPKRSFTGWLKVPFSYGSLDVVRALGDGGRTWGRVQHAYVCRNRATQLLADICLYLPFLSKMFRYMLLWVAKMLHQANQRTLAFALLSAVYNVHYLEGAAQAIGSTSALRYLMKTSDLRGFATFPSGKTVGAS